MRTPVVALIAAMSSGSAFAADDAPTADGIEIRVLTFNTWGLPAPLAHSRRDRFPGIDALVHQDRWDVVGLQELWWGARRLVDGDRLHLPSGRDDSGLAVLSRWRAGEPRLHVFRQESGLDSWKSKGVLATELVVPDIGSVWLLDTHLQSGRTDRASAVRSNQVDEILAVIGEIDGPVVLVGDFNLYEDLPLDVADAGRLADAGLQDAAVALGQAGATYPDGSRLDRVFVRGSDGILLATEAIEPIAGADGLSDHHPLAIRLRARRPPDPVASSE